MPDLAKLVAPPAQPGDPDGPLALATKAVVATTPANTTQPVYVTIPDRDPEGRGWRWGPCAWTPRVIDGSTYGIPSTGDLALVMFDEEDEPWIVMWWPYAL